MIRSSLKRIELMSILRRMRTENPIPDALSGARSVSRCGFTRIDLAAVLAILLLLGGMLAPALGSSVSQVQRLACLGHLKRLMLAWHAYAQDHQDKVVMVIVGVDMATNNAPWAMGWLDWGTSPD